MPQVREIRADFDRESIVIYQAYSAEIAEPALRAQKFVAPFSFQRMTWIKPSFLWLMHRSNWGRKRGQERTLAVHIKRAGWEKALSLAVLTSFEPALHASPEAWRELFRSAKVHLQWDPERSLRGAAQPFYSLQIGLSRHVISEYANDWIISIEDYTPLAAKCYKLVQSGQAGRAKRLLPAERIYPVNPQLSRQLLIGA